jgi:hypothetical protein
MNWYKLAKSEQKSESKPYKLRRFMKGRELEPTAELKDAYVEAFSKDQARIKFLKRFKYLYDFVGSGGDIEVILDIDRINERKKTEENRKSRYDEIVQDAWWNK